MLIENVFKGKYGVKKNWSEEFSNLRFSNYVEVRVGRERTSGRTTFG
jgi:hypothetical protein